MKSIFSSEKKVVSRQQTKDLVGRQLNKQLPALVRSNVASLLLDTTQLKEVLDLHKKTLLELTQSHKAQLQDFQQQEIANAKKRMHEHADRICAELARSDESSRIVGLIQNRVDSRFWTGLIISAAYLLGISFDRNNEECTGCSHLNKTSVYKYELFQFKSQ
jgi:hypothetical protein